MRRLDQNDRKRAGAGGAASNAIPRLDRIQFPLLDVAFDHTPTPFPANVF